MAKRADQTYIDFDPYVDDCEVKYRKVKIVTTRKEHTCAGVPGFDATPRHSIPAGTQARYETALVDGAWDSYYTCLTCLDAYMDSEAWAFR